MINSCRPLASIAILPVLLPVKKLAEIRPRRKTTPTTVRKQKLIHYSEFNTKYIGKQWVSYVLICLLISDIT